MISAAIWAARSITETVQRPEPDVLLCQFRKVHRPQAVLGNICDVPTDAFRRDRRDSNRSHAGHGPDRPRDPGERHYDPDTTQNGVRVRPVSNNVIAPTSSIRPPPDPVDIPGNEGGLTNTEQSGTTVRKNEITSVKIDHSLTDKAKISFFYQNYRAKFGNKARTARPPITSGAKVSIVPYGAHQLDYPSVQPCCCMRARALSGRDTR
jgi:hypothetical protein